MTFRKVYERCLKGHQPFECFDDLLIVLQKVNKRCLKGHQPFECFDDLSKGVQIVFFLVKVSKNWGKVATRIVPFLFAYLISLTLPAS